MSQNTGASPERADEEYSHIDDNGDEHFVVLEVTQDETGTSKLCKTTAVLRSGQKNPIVNLPEVLREGKIEEIHSHRSEIRKDLDKQGYKPSAKLATAGLVSGWFKGPVVRI